MDESETKLSTKLTQLRITTKRTKALLDAGQTEAIERHQVAVKIITAEADNLRRTVEAFKIEDKQQADEIDAWNIKIETEIDEADQSVERLKQWTKDQKTKQEIHEREEQIKFEVKLHETKMKLQSELATVKSNPAEATSEVSNIHAKLPKLVVTKFSGLYTDWPRFWGQFSETNEKTNVAPITKFAYLRELLDDKVKKVVEALPYTPEGYNRAKAILHDRYGKESEIVKAHIKEILELPYIPTANTKKVHEFHDKLTYNVQSLETLNKISQVDGAVSMTLDKLTAIRGDLVRTDTNWEKWNFVQLTEALRLWTRRNPVDTLKPEDPPRKREKSNKVYKTNQKRDQTKPNLCVYCESSEHKSVECSTIKSSEDRKKILAKKKLCYNCTGRSHRAAECRSTTTCRKCAKRHHTSICDEKPESEKMYSAHQSDNGEVIYPVVLLEIDGIKTRALLDTGAGSSYASAKLINALHKKPTETKTKRIEMMFGATTMKVETYSAQMKSIDGDFLMDINLTKVDKPELMYLDNPNYQSWLNKYPHLHGIQIHDVDAKQELPIHIVLGASEYAAIKSKTAPRVGLPGQPVAEKTLLGWTIMSPGREVDTSPLMLTRSTSTDYEQLCNLDVLGLEDAPEHDQNTVYREFKEQLQRNKKAWYETGLPWKANHPELSTNKMGSLSRLQQLVRKLERNGDYSKYDEIIQDQIEHGVVEKAPEVVTGREFYIPHKAVVRQDAESTKLRVVYDASARERNDQPSLNDCLNPGPPLQNLLWNVLVKTRFHPVMVTGDLQKAFLQIRIRSEERDALRFHWRHPQSSNIETYRFTRALFGLTCSPFLLGGVLNQHLAAWEDRHPEMVEELRSSMHVDDLLLGGNNVSEAKSKKEIAKEIFEDGCFKLHKFHSNAIQLEAEFNDEATEADELSYAKQQLGTTAVETKILGLPWNKASDTLRVEFPQEKGEPTKRGVLSSLAKVYDPLGIASPTVLSGKMIFREISDKKLAWDTELPHEIQKRWNNWYEKLPESISLPRSVAPHQQPIQNISLHAFGDASIQGVCVVVYAVVDQKDGVTQGIVTAKSRLAKRGLTIPRLELVAGHMAANLINNVHQALRPMVARELHCWLDSTVALYWIQGSGQYKQFVSNRVNKIREHTNIKWHHVPTSENPADLGSRGGSVTNSQWWSSGPSWLADSEQWPPDITPVPCAASKAEAKMTKEVLAVVVPTNYPFNTLIDKFELWKVLRIGAWMQRFVGNCRPSVEKRKSGPLTTEDIETQKTWWTKRTQCQIEATESFKKDQVRLNLQPNHQQILECRGRLQGEHPIYLPDHHPFTMKSVQEAHLETLHGGVSLTMAKIRERYCRVPRLRCLVKKIRRKCWGCKRFQLRAFESPPPGNLPTTRTQGDKSYQVIGVDFAGPIKYQIRAKTVSKAYLVIYACSLTRGVYLELLPSLETDQFLTSLKRFIARRGRPQTL